MSGQILRSKLNHTPAMPHFLSLLHHSLLLPLDYGAAPQHWLLFDRVVQQIVLQVILILPSHWSLAAAILTSDWCRPSCRRTPTSRPSPST